MKLYRAFATVGGLTMVSRMLGFVRDVLIAAGLGTGPVADAFVVAFRLPNLFRRLFAEGAFNSAFVPLFARKLEGDGANAARRFAEDAMAGLLLILLLLTALAEIAMPLVIFGLAPGFAGASDKFDLTVQMSRIAFPYLACMSLVALLSGVLNSLGRFTAAAAAPILLNVVMIIAMIAVLGFGLDNKPEAGIALSIGVAIAGFAQLFMLAYAAYRVNMGLGFRLPRLTDDVRRLVALGVPGLISGGVTQINIVVGTIIASLEAGAASFLYYADRVYQLPLGIVGVAMGVVLLPEISRHLRAGRVESAMDAQNRGLEFALALTIPASIALVVLAEPISRVLFERGAFSTQATDATAWALAGFAFGLPAFVAQKVFQPAFFAREDTATPMRFATYNLVINAAGSVALFFLFKELGLWPHAGIAVATTIAGWVNAVLLWWALRSHGHLVLDRRFRRNLPLIILASIAMGVFLWGAAVWLNPWFRPGGSTLPRLGVLAALTFAGLAAYSVAIFATGVIDFRKLGRRAA